MTTQLGQVPYVAFQSVNKDFVSIGFKSPCVLRSCMATMQASLQSPAPGNERRARLAGIRSLSSAVSPFPAVNHPGR